MCQSLLGLHPIISEIDKKKLYFLQKLCTFDDVYISKKIFITRLFSFFIDTNRVQHGFIPDIVSVLYKYQLHDYMTDFLFTSFFPDKRTWKIIVNRTVNSVQSDEWNNRVHIDSDFKRFINIHKSVIMNKFWNKVKSCVEIRDYYFITKLITVVPDSTPGVCTICQRTFTDVYVHACCNCTSTSDLRSVLWDIILENFTFDLFVELYFCDEEDLFQIFLGKPVVTENIDTIEFSALCHRHVVHCIAKFAKLGKNS